MASPNDPNLFGKAWTSLSRKGPAGLVQDAREYLQWRLASHGAASPRPQGAPLSNWDLNQQELASLPDTLSSKPILVYAEATSRCNLRCFMCRLQFPETTRQHRDHMKLETYALLEPLLEPGSRLSLFGLGEPLLNPSFVEMLRIATERGATVGLNSNAMLLDERISRAMVDLEQELLVISFSGGTRDTYEKVITGANYDRVLANLRRLNELKREKAGEGVPLEQVKPVLQLQFTAMRDNVHEVSEMVKLAIELRCAGAVVMPLTIFDPSLGDQSLLEPALWPEIEASFEAARAMAASAPYPFDLQLPTTQLLAAMAAARTADGAGSSSGSDDLSLSTHPSICHEPWQTFYARDDGTVNTCCYSNRVMGDLKSQTALEIWNGEMYRRFRARMRSENKPAECRVCHKLRGDDWYDQRVEDETFYDEL